MLNNDLTINKMRASDIADVKAIEEECRLSPWSFDDYRSEIDRRDAIALVAKIENKVVGFIITRLITSSAISSFLEAELEINNIGVSARFRRFSIGKNLLESVINELTAYDSVYLFLEVRQSNKGAIEFYREQQFAEIGVRKNYYSNPAEDALVMRRRIVNS